MRRILILYWRGLAISGRRSAFVRFSSSPLYCYLNNKAIYNVPRTVIGSRCTGHGVSPCAESFRRDVWADFTITGTYDHFMFLDWLSLEDLLVASVRWTATLLTCSEFRPKFEPWVSRGREKGCHVAFLVALYHPLRYLYLRLMNPSHLSESCLWSLTRPIPQDERAAT